MNGVITTDVTKSDAELVAMATDWSIVGRDLLSVVSSKDIAVWKNKTEEEWEFNELASSTDRFKVCA